MEEDAKKRVDNMSKTARSIGLRTSINKEKDAEHHWGLGNTGGYGVKGRQVQITGRIYNRKKHEHPEDKIRQSDEVEDGLPCEQRSVQKKNITRQR